MPETQPAQGTSDLAHTLTTCCPHALHLGHRAVLISRCACSLQQRRAVFSEHLVSEARWAKDANELLANADLYCCLGDTAYPWREAAPAVLGCLAFPGYPWSANMGPGLQMAADASRRATGLQRVSLFGCRVAINDWLLGCLAFPGYPWSANVGPGLQMAAEVSRRSTGLQ